MQAQRTRDRRKHVPYRDSRLTFLLQVGGGHPARGEGEGEGVRLGAACPPA